MTLPVRIRTMQSYRMEFVFWGLVKNVIDLFTFFIDFYAIIRENHSKFGH